MDNFYIHQSLHGYNNGHSLLATSTTLSVQSQQILFTMSDMSGFAMVEEFEEYLTGYPLPQMNVFAFAKTWYADEMERPGCVWTHTLLIDFSDLAQIKNLRILDNYFVKPLSQQDYRNYREEITVTDYDNIVYNENINEIQKNIIACLYGFPNESIIIPAKSSSNSITILMLWSQQWPRLRRRFTFCSGSLSNRTIYNKPLDLQFIPYSNLHTIQNKTNNTKIINVNECIDFDWLKTSIEDLRKPGKLRAFLWRFGADIGGGRDVYVSLIKIFFCIEYSGSVKSQLVELIASSFPQSNDACTLKSTVFQNFFPIDIEIDLLFELATSKKYQAFDGVVNLKAKVSLLWEKQKEITISLLLKLVKTHLNKIGELFLVELIKVIPERESRALLKNYPSLIYNFINVNPDLAAISEIWNVSLEQDKKIFSVLIEKKECIYNWEKIVFLHT